ncbi:MAG: hypothetical protein H7839_17655 [Magnetococcus sp. YQC-5]
MKRAKPVSVVLVVGMLTLAVCTGRMVRRRKREPSRIIVMKEINFITQASNKEPAYMVTVRKEESNLTARCTCPAGGVGQICRHRLSILSGDEKVVISDNSAQIKEIEAWVVWSDVGMLIAHLAQAQWRLQKIQEDAERSASAFDKAFDEVRTIERLLIQAINN